MSTPTHAPSDLLEAARAALKTERERRERLADIAIAFPLLVLVFMPGTILLLAWAASCCWRWYLAPTYGAGPGIEGWAGVAVIVDLMALNFTAPRAAQTKAPAGGYFKSLVQSKSLLAVSVLLLLAVAYAVKAVLW